jgi:DNA-binding transcriptional LysR family regulator
MELRHLRYFIGVAETLGFSRAAARLNITQPALSRQIRDLERELGLRLFDRIGRQVRLTPQGEDLLGRSRTALADIEALRDRARSLQEGRTGTIRVGATPQVLQSVVAGFLARYRRSHQRVDVELVEAGSVRLVSLVEEGALHLALGPVLASATVCGRVLFPARILAVMPTSSRVPRARSVNLSTLAGERLLLLRREFATRQILDAAFQLARLTPRVALESSDAHCLVTLAAAGHGVAIVPSTLLVPRGRLRIAPVIHGTTSLGFWVAVVWDPRRFLPTYGEEFVSELVEYTRRGYPGKRFERLAPAVHRPDSPIAGPHLQPTAPRPAGS